MPHGGRGSERSLFEDRADVTGPARPSPVENLLPLAGFDLRHVRIEGLEPEGEVGIGDVVQGLGPGGRSHRNGATDKPRCHHHLQGMFDALSSLRRYRPIPVAPPSDGRKNTRVPAGLRQFLAKDAQRIVQEQAAGCARQTREVRLHAQALIPGPKCSPAEVREGSPPGKRFEQTYAPVRSWRGLESSPIRAHGGASCIRYPMRHGPTPAGLVAGLLSGNPGSPASRSGRLALPPNSAGPLTPGCSGGAWHSCFTDTR